ncbi:hypothetical protein [Streptomyces hoynatensis]|uniref:Secreted protein n=1 Tax=Streptomyces hoynatensis TaxID=1141874 RepID=A0A3A9YVW9_9ACTN|nr:hypothetical protein [Streptomyces hoynatensis]RKN40040.1 hypothetical protein D7294_19150 [Streptomyces hoynatensis]
MKLLPTAGAALAALLLLGSGPAHAAGSQPPRGASADEGRTVALGLSVGSAPAGSPGARPHSAAEADEYVECSWSIDPYVQWWWDGTYTLTQVAVQAEGYVACDPDIYGIESELYVRHDDTRISVDADACLSDDGDECATSTTAATHTCTAGTWCAGDWAPGLEIRLQLDGDSWDADTFPDYCDIQGADDEVARCYLEVSSPTHVPPTFPPDAAAAPAS